MFIVVVLSGRPIWSWNPDLLNRCSHLVQGDYSLFHRCLFFTLSLFPAICSASLSWKSGKERVLLVPPALLLPAASALLTTSCSWNRVWGVSAAKHQQWQYFPCMGSHHSLCRTLKRCYLARGVSPCCLCLEQSEREGWLTLAFLEKKVYCSSSKSCMLLENAYKGSHT